MVFSNQDTIKYIVLNILICELIFLSSLEGIYIKKTQESLYI